MNDCKRRRLLLQRIHSEHVGHLRGNYFGGAVPNFDINPKENMFHHVEQSKINFEIVLYKLARGFVFST